tara:strand:+ start:849 stop:1343 length:495 start_codon:yes stop_codon:yes gene_type:complete
MPTGIKGNQLVRTITPKKRYNMDGTGSPYASVKNCWKLLVNRAKGNAKPGYMKGNGVARTESLEVNIDEQWLKEQYERQNKCCYWSGYPIDIESVKERNNPLAPSLDRLDDNKGYTKDNVVLTIRLFNLGRQTCPEKKFRGVCDKIRDHYNGKQVVASLSEFID